MAQAEGLSQFPQKSLDDLAAYLMFAAGTNPKQFDQHTKAPSHHTASGF